MNASYPTVVGAMASCRSVFAPDFIRPHHDRWFVITITDSGTGLHARRW